MVYQVMVDQIKCVAKTVKKVIDIRHHKGKNHKDNNKDNINTLNNHNSNNNTITQSLPIITIKKHSNITPKNMDNNNDNIIDQYSKK